MVMVSRRLQAAVSARRRSGAALVVVVRRRSRAMPSARRSLATVVVEVSKMGHALASGTVRRSQAAAATERRRI